MGKWGPAAYSGYMWEEIHLRTVGPWGKGPAAYSGYMWAGSPAAYSGYMWEGIHLRTIGPWGEGSSYLQWVLMGRESSCLQWVHGVQLLTVDTWSPANYSGYMKARGPASYSVYLWVRVQLLTMSTCTWGQGFSCFKRVHEGAGNSSCLHQGERLAGYTVYMGGKGLQWDQGAGFQQLTVGT